MSALKQCKEWAEEHIRDAEARGAKLDLIVMPESSEILLRTAAMKENPSEDVYRTDDKNRVYLCGVRVKFDPRLGKFAWFRYLGGKQ